MGADYWKMAASNMAGECGVDVDVEIDYNACMGAISSLGSMDRDCPRACSEELTAEDREGRPLCEAGQPERSAASCGTEECAATLQS